MKMVKCNGDKCFALCKTNNWLDAPSPPIEVFFYGPYCSPNKQSNLYIEVHKKAWDLLGLGYINTCCTETRHLSGILNHF